jgi:hypothetical protein
MNLKVILQGENLNCGEKYVTRLHCQFLTTLHVWHKNIFEVRSDFDLKRSTNSNPLQMWVQNFLGADQSLIPAKNETENFKTMSPIQGI